MPANGLSEVTWGFLRLEGGAGGAAREAEVVHSFKVFRRAI